MNDHAVDAMIYAWMVVKEKEEKMEGIFLGKIDQSEFNPRRISLSFGTKHLDQHVAVGMELDYNCDYMLVKADDVITTNDELLKLRDEVKRLTDKCNDWKARYSKTHDEYGKLDKAYGIIATDRDALKERVEKLEEELMKIKTARTLREAYITGVEKGCESLREDRDLWKNRWNRVVTDIGKTLEQNGINFVLKEINGEGNWDVVIDIPELTEAKEKIADLEKKLADAKSKETFWRDRKEEEEEYHHYWLHTFDRVVKQAAEKGVYINVRTTDEECNAGVVIVNNVKAEDLEKQVVQMEDANQKLRQRISAADEEIENLKARDIPKVAQYWRDTYYSAVEKAKNEGVTIVVAGMDLDRNIARLQVINHRAANLKKQIKRLEDDNSVKAEAVVAAKYRGDAWMEEHNNIVRNYHNLEKSQEKKWSAMTEALKEKGVEVIYMGEEDGKPIVDVKVPEAAEDEIYILRKEHIVNSQRIGDLNAEVDKLKTELDDLKKKTVAEVRYEWKVDCLTVIYTMCDGSKQTIGMDSSEAIDASSISCGTIPTCKSCAHYMHNPSRFAHDWCYKPVSKEGPGTIRKLTKEEAEGPCCKDYKEREPMCEDCIYPEERGCVGTRTGEACFGFERKKKE